MEGGWKGLLQPYVTATPISIVSRPARRRRSSHNDRMVVSTEADEAGIKPQELVELPANDFIKWGGGDLSRAGVILQCMSHLEPGPAHPARPRPVRVRAVTCRACLRLGLVDIASTYRGEVDMGGWARLV